MKPYDPKQVEEKWLKKWRQDHLFQGTTNQETPTRSGDQKKEKYYALFAFAYPSGSGLHVGHVESMTALDMLVRYLRMNGKHVFFPVGWDAFGLPAENYAIKTGIAPAKTTFDAIATFEKQVERVGISYDWDSEIATCHPGYYKWTQWIFMQLFKAGLAYRDMSSVNWCPSDKTVLANEQVINGECERCGSKVIQKELEQWKFKITAYQDELIEGLAKVDWPKSTKLQQENWIGRSQGVEVEWLLKETKIKLLTFTTRLDTIYGVTFVVISPEKFKDLGLIDRVCDSQKTTVNTYLDAASHKTEEERRVGEKDKTGVSTGLTLIHPLTGKEIPLWIADYVLAGYGTGIVMGVPAKDERDGAFARRHNLPVLEIDAPPEQIQKMSQALLKDYPEHFKATTTYKLRDWLISRQRYWGAPIPMVYCEACAKNGQGERSQMNGWYSVPEESLPVVLPQVPDFQPTDDGHSPLEKASDSWKFTTCPGCGSRAKREVDTMDTFVDSSWYFLRYTDARNEKVFADKKRLEKWLPVDTYLIGPEHTVLHLLYSRFFTKFLRDQKYLDFDEPFLKMRHQGMILGPDGKKMSKSKGNVISPDSVIEKFGADTLRVYEMFMGPLDADKAWDTNAVAGVYRFLNKIYALVTNNKELVASKGSLQRKLHKTIKKLDEDIPEYKYNTSIAALMEFSNLWSEVVKDGEGLSAEDLLSFIKILAPFAPYLAEELWQATSFANDVAGTRRPEDQEYRSVHQQKWPKFDLKLVQEDEIEIVVQFNAKIKGHFKVSASQAKDKNLLSQMGRQVLEKQGIALESEFKVIVVPNKLVNICSK